MDSLTNYLCFSHAHKKPDHNGFQILQDALDNVDVLIGHNIKFDISWLVIVGLSLIITYTILWLQSIFWLVLGVETLGLKAVAEKYGTEKKKDLVDDYEKGITFYDIPWDIVKSMV